MFWFGFGIGVYTTIIIKFIVLVIYAIKGGRGK